ncbi:MAG: acyl-CoA dehydrogenase [Bilifractor sp.]|jgi:butyryl-CoA dehydrogenase
MELKLSREQELVRKMVRDFAENEIAPIAADTDKNSEYPAETIDKLFRYGVMGMCVPKEYGGAGADDLSATIAIEEISKACASTGDIVATHNGLCCNPIITYGTEEQKKKYLPMLTTGHKVGAFCLTEPNAGSDASKGTTTAVLDGDHYVLNGSKIFITNGYVADVLVVFAMTNPALGTKGISAFIVESSFPGFSVGKHEEKMGLHGSPTAEIVFTDCIVPKENLLGIEGKGFNIAMATLDGGRIGIAAQSLGIAEGAMKEAMDFTKTRVQFGRPISKFQNTQFKFADMYVGVQAGQLLTYKAALAKMTQKRFTVEAACAKLFCSELAMKTTTEAVQMFGGYGYTKDYPVERMMRDAKITEIYEGTSEIQRVVISGNILRK